MNAEVHDPDSDWSAASFEGARREQMRRWAQLPLERILMAIEEMDEIAIQLRQPVPGTGGDSAPPDRFRS